MDLAPSLLTAPLRGLPVWVLQEIEGESQPTAVHVRTTESPTCAATCDPGEMSTVNGFSGGEEKEKEPDE